MSVFGFTRAASSGSDFIPIIKYDARAGRISRVDRADNGSGFVSTPIDITGNFKAIADFENIETGWISFPLGGVPSFVMVPLEEKLPDRPTPDHKNGIRFMVKLSKDCGGDRPIREIAGNSDAFLNGVEGVYNQYLAGRAANPGLLPVLMLEKVTPVTTGTAYKSTNYHPVFKIVGWQPRGDLQPRPRAQAQPAQGSFANGNGGAPSTGAQRAAPPQAAPQAAPQQATQTVSPDDFG